MKNLYLILLFAGLSCKQNLDIPQEKLKETLLAFGKENPETEVVIKTSLGTIEAILYKDTPLHRANFIRLIKAGYYDERIIYRIVKGVCVQGGANQSDHLNYLIPSEFSANRIHRKGALSMARYHDNNPDKMSSAAEFFIITSGFDQPNAEPKTATTANELYHKYGGYSAFDNDYTVFGEVTKGLEVAEAIGKLPLRDTDKPIKKIQFSVALK